MTGKDRATTSSCDRYSLWQPLGALGRRLSTEHGNSLTFCIPLQAWYAFVYLILKIESHNITNAAIMNMEAGDDIRHQLGSLTSEQWALILSIFHYPYMVFEPFSTLLLKKFTPRKWMSRMMVSWGIVAMCKRFLGTTNCDIC